MELKPKIFWPVFIALVVLFYAVRLGSPHLVESWYSSGKLGLLNKITGAETLESLGYYYGACENALFGPLAILLSGSAFLLFGWVYLKRSGIFIFSLAVLGYFILTRWEVLFYPPYGDTASGPLSEGIWLLQNSFDFAALSRQPGIVEGGPKVYLFSIYPAFQALLMKFLPPAQAYVIVNHLLSFYLAAAVVAVFRKILLKIYNEEFALLLSVLLLALPLYQAQAEAINMEFPLVFFSILAVYYLIEKNVCAASIYANLAVMAKGIGIIASASVFAVAVFLFLFDKEHRFRFKTLFWGLFALVFMAMETYAAFFILNPEGNVPMVGWLRGWEEHRKLPVLYLCAGSFFVFILLYFWEWSRKSAGSFADYLRKHFLALVMFTCCAAWFMLFIHSYGAQYRYRLLLAPFSLFCIFYVIEYFVKNRIIVNFVLTAGIIVSLIGSYGCFMKPKNGPATNPAAMERSLEYRNDVKVYAETIKFIEENFSDYLIGAPFTLSQSLAFPELGFVKKKLNVMQYSYPITYGGIRNFNGLNELDQLRTVWVGVEHDLAPDMMKALEHYPFGPEDMIVKRFQYGNRYAVVFFGGTYIERLLLLHKIIYEKQMQQKILSEVLIK